MYLDRAIKAGHKDIVLVEGVLDAALLQSVGDTRVCAYVAASCSESQIETLKRHKVKSVTLCGDPDDGSKNGTLSNLARISKAGIAVYVAPKLPDGLDPDEFLLREGLDCWKHHIGDAIHGYTYKAQSILAQADVSKDKGKEEALQTAIAFSKTISDTEAKLSLNTFFWPRICEGLRMDLEDFRRQLEAAYQHSSTDVPDNAEVSLETDPDTRLRLELQALLKETDPIKRMRLRGEIASHYRLNKAEIEEALNEIKQRTTTPETQWYALDDFFDLSSEGLQ